MMQYFDEETGLHYNHFQYYDPEIGRYITSDPIGLIGGWNTFGYARSNPILFIDPSGLIVCFTPFVIEVVAAGTGGAVSGGIFGGGPWGAVSGALIAADTTAIALQADSDTAGAGVAAAAGAAQGGGRGAVIGGLTAALTSGAASDCQHRWWVARGCCRRFCWRSSIL